MLYNVHSQCTTNKLVQCLYFINKTFNKKLREVDLICRVKCTLYGVTVYFSYKDNA